MARQSYSEDMKLHLRQHYRKNPHLTQIQLLKWFKKTYKKPLRQALISDWLSNKFTHLDGVTKAPITNRRMRESLYPELDKALFEWYSKIEEGRWVRPIEIIEQAKLLWPTIYPNQIQPQFSTGWLTGFRNRYKARNLKGIQDVTGESEGHILILEKIRKKMEKYSPAEIYRCDETGIFFNDFQNKSLANKLHKGGQYSDSRFTVYLCSNGDGSDKIIPWIIANDQVPGVSRKEFTSQNCVWRRSPNSWMNTSQMVEWLMNFDKHVGRRIFPLPFEEKKMLLLMDDFSAHRKAVELCNTSGALKNTEVCFLPPTTTSEKPLLNGFIHRFRANYQESIGLYAIDQYDSGCKDLNKMSISDAVKSTIEAWSRVSRSTIRYTWNQSKVCQIPLDKAILDSDVEQIQQEKKSHSDIYIQLCSQLDKRQLLNRITLMDYPSHDDDDGDDDEEENL